MREVLLARIERWGFSVRCACSVAEGRALVSAFDPHVVISDLVLPDATGLDLLRALQGSRDDRLILLITAYGTINSAVQAIKAGATDFLTKPLDYVDLRRRLEERYKQMLVARPVVQVQPSAASANDAVGRIVGTSSAVASMMEEVRTAAASDAPVLVVGESGAGKELVARTIHALGERKDEPFLLVNGAAIPEKLVESEAFGVERGAYAGAGQTRRGLFEQAGAGTLFLDDFTEIPLGLQSKFLRVLEERADRRLGDSLETSRRARIVVATTRDPAEAVREGKLRQDLLHRLDVLRVGVPALRERTQDIPALVEHFVLQCSRRYNRPLPQLELDAVVHLQTLPWPGNIRELRNVVERAFLASHKGVLGLTEVRAATHDAPEQAQPPSSDGIVIPDGVTAAEAERILILETLRRTGQNKAETARRLGLDVKTIRNKLKTFGLPGPSR